MNEVGANWPLLRAVRDDSVYLQRYRAEMRGFVDRVFTQAAMDSLFNAYHGLISPHVVGPNGEQPGHTYVTAASFSSALPALKAHVAARRVLIGSWVP
jgi:hypothetical protein